MCDPPDGPLLEVPELANVRLAIVALREAEARAAAVVA